MNSPGLTVEDVSLQLDKSGRYIEGKVQVIITLKNNSPTSTCYVPKRPREIAYDKSSRTLTIGLYENEPPPSPLSPPEQLPIPPATTLQWHYLIPLWMKKITRPPGSREIVEVLDLSAVQKVTCIAAPDISASFERTLVQNH
jgi:hypothetical protein